MNRYDPTRAYQSQLRRQQERKTIAIAYFRNGVKAAAKAARELINEGQGSANDFESLVFRRIEEHRKCRTQINIEANQLPPENSEVENSEIKDGTN
jgi:hypothetical protein